MSEATTSTIEVTDSSFATEVLASSKPVLVDCWATWCNPCKMVAPVLEEIAREQSKALTIAKLDIDANPETTRTYQVMSVPTMLLFQNGKLIKQIVGAKPKATLLRELAEVI